MTKPVLKLVGNDGNAFAILGNATMVARKAGWTPDRIKEFQSKAMSGDYNNLLCVCVEYFEVK